MICLKVEWDCIYKQDLKDVKEKLWDKKALEKVSECIGGEGKEVNKARLGGKSGADHQACALEHLVLSR